MTLVTNASTAEMYGLELDVTWLPTDQLTLRGNLGLLEAEYKDFEFVTAAGPGDLSHLELRRAPEVSGSLSATYEWQMGSGQAWAVLAWHSIGEYEVDFVNKPELTNDSQDIVGASLNYAMGPWQFAAFGHNLLDEDAYSVGFDVAGLWSYASTRPPRTFGIEASYTFGN